MSAAVPSSIAPADARLSICGVASMISFVESPAIPRYCMAAADSDADQAVEAPRSIACCRSRSNWSPVAPVTAWTFRMESSKSTAVLTISPPARASGAVSFSVRSEPTLDIRDPMDLRSPSSPSVRFFASS